MSTTVNSIDELLAAMAERNASDLHLTAGSPPVIRVNGRLERLTDTRTDGGRDARPRLPDRLDRAAEAARDEAPARLLVLGSGPRALPRQRLLPAREHRRRVPHDPGADQDARGAEPARAPLRARRQAARPRPRHRPDRLRQVDDARRAARPHQPDARTSTSSRSRIRSSSSTGTGTASSTSARSARTRPRSPKALRAALRQDPDVILVGEMRDLETIAHRADRGRDGPPGLRDAAHPERAADDRPHHRRLPGRAAGPGARSARRRRCRGSSRRTSSRPPTAAAASPRSRSSCPTTPSGT